VWCVCGVVCAMRGGLVAPGNWLIMGASDPPELTSIYYEVLAMNSELTNLIRRLSKEQSRLNAQLSMFVHKRDAF